jgi:hypothetical protein
MATTVAIDAESLVARYLRTIAAVTALVEQRVFTEEPKLTKLPKVRLHRIGGVEAVGRWLDAPRIQVEAWAESKAIAHDVAATVKAAMHDMVGTFVSYIDGPQGVVTGVEESLGLQWLPDERVKPPKPRYVFEMVVFLHPKPA